jgi:hypothetical protein
MPTLIPLNLGGFQMFLFNRLLVLLVTVVLLPVTSSLPATADPTDPASPTSTTAPAAAVHRKKKVEQRHKEWIRVTGEIRRHKRRIAHVRVKNTSGSGGAVRARHRAVEYACVVRTNRRDVIPYPPLRVSGSGNSFTHRWLLFVYRIDRARRIGVHRRLRQQFEMCAVGGGHTWNKWAANFAGASVTLDNWQDIRIGQSWGERVESDGGVHAELGFKLARGIAEVGASVPVGIDDEHRFTGNDGYDERINLPDGWNHYNRVNAYYQSGDDWTFQGTDRHVGNTLHVLYETRQRGTKPLHWILSAKIRAHCTKWWQVFGRDCEDFD